MSAVFIFFIIIVVIIMGFGAMIAKQEDKPEVETTGDVISSFIWNIVGAIIILGGLYKFFFDGGF